MASIDICYAVAAYNCVSEKMVDAQIMLQSAMKHKLILLYRNSRSYE
jgi:hypothetical protein